MQKAAKRGLVLLASLLPACSAQMLGNGAQIVFPSGADFGTLRSGEAGRRLVTLKNQGSGLWGLSQGPFSGPFAFTGGTFPGTNGTCGDSVENDASCLLDITYSPLAGGSYPELGLPYRDVLGRRSLTTAVTANAIGGNLDLSFANGGVMISAALASSSAVGQILPLPDGRIVVTGQGSADGVNTHIYAARYDNAGNLDPSFATNGVQLISISATTDYNIGAAALQPDSRILIGGYSAIAGHSAFSVIRLNADGSFDPFFGSGGITIAQVQSGDTAVSLHLQPDGKIIVTGYSDDGVNNFPTAVRFNSDGSLDTSYGTGGSTFTSIGSGSASAWYSALDSQGRVVLPVQATVGGTPALGLVRFGSDGSLDASFGSGGKVAITVGGGSAYPMSIQVQPDGKILVGSSYQGTGSSQFLLSRFLDNGSLDPTFGGGGHVLTSYGSAGATQVSLILLQPDGKILATGHYDNAGDWDCAIGRYNPDGSLDPTFGNGGTNTATSSPGVNDFCGAIALQTDGKILAGNRSTPGGVTVSSLFRFWP